MHHAPSHAPPFSPPHDVTAAGCQRQGERRAREKKREKKETRKKRAARQRRGLVLAIAHLVLFFFPLCFCQIPTRKSGLLTVDHWPVYFFFLVPSRSRGVCRAHCTGLGRTGGGALFAEKKKKRERGLDRFGQSEPTSLCPFFLSTPPLPSPLSPLLSLPLLFRRTEARPFRYHSPHV